MSFIKFDLKEDFYTKEEIESELEDLNVLIEDLQDRLEGLSLNIDGEGVLRLTTDDNNNVYVGNLYTTKSYVDNKVSEILTRLGVSSSENGVLLLGNKSVIQSGDVATFIVTVYGENNLVVSDEEVTFEFYSSVDDSLLDTIVKTTSFKGIASCTYTGVGRGSVYCKASIQRNNSIIVSEPYNVLDTLFYDKGNNSNWYNGGGFTVTPSTDDGKTLKVSNTSSAYYNANMTSSPSPNFDVNTCIEFDIENAGTGFRIYVRNGSTRPYKAIPTGNSHIKVTTDGSKVYWDVDGTVTNNDFAVSTYYAYFSGDKVDNTLVFKNFKVYPI